MVDLEKMTTKQLEAFARKEFDVELDRRHNKKHLLATVQELMEDRDEESESLPKEIEEQEPISATEIVAPENSWKGGERHDTTLWRTKGFASEKTYRRFLGLD